MSSDTQDLSKNAPKLKRILIKLSGESLSADQSFGISVDSAKPILKQIKTLVDSGIEVAIVIGGGNILRGGRTDFGDKIRRATADSMGMIATMINALALRDMLISEGVDTEIFSAKGVDGLIKSASAHEFNQVMACGKVVVFAGGTGNPYVTTDTTASLRAIEIGADALLKATTVDGVYDRDPNKHSDAKRYESISFDEIVAKELSVMDLGAFTQCRDFNLPIYVFDMSQPDALLDAVTTSKYGTWVGLGLNFKRKFFNMINEILQDAEVRMNKSLDVLADDLAKIRTGRAHPDILAHVTIDYYGTPTSITQVANVNVLDARTLGITPWEKGLSGQIEKAIITSDLGLNPTNLGDSLRVPMPALNEERRKELVKLVKSETESGRISIRNIRRDANGDIKDLLKEKEINEDEAKRAEAGIQKITDKMIAQADSLAAKKEQDLMAV